MRRVVTTCLLLAVVGAVAYYLVAGRESTPLPKYTVELDNAFGIVEGADLKVAGVRAGKIKTLRIDPDDHRALVDFEITKDGFGSLRKDVFCESRPQSLIGEYYIDCRPGVDRQKLARGATIPVEQTASTIPLDLVNNVLRRPYRERLGIILDELGVGVAGRAPDINDVIRRASPALRETNKVLVRLGDQNQVITRLIEDADTVIGDLSGNRRNVVRWARETKETAAASAERRADIAAGLRRLPTFLRELRPTMAALGGAAEAQTPSLRNLNASAGQLTRFLENLEPFSEATQVNMRSLAETSRKGRPAVRAARPLVGELASATDDAPELANNLAIVLEHLDDRKFAVEPDPRSPGGKGYTGFEALLSYPFDQAMAINTYDKNGYILKVNLFESKCSDYQNLQSLKEEMAKDPEFFKDCAAMLGPNLPGITQPDPTATGRQFHSADKDPRKRADRKDSREERRDEPARRQAGEAERGREGESRRPESRRDAARPDLQREIGKRLQDQLGIDLPDVPGAPAPPAPGAPPLPPLPSAPNLQEGAPPAAGTANQLLDYLFAP